MKKVYILLLFFTVSINMIAQSSIDYFSCLDAHWNRVQESIGIYGKEAPQTLVRFFETESYYSYIMRQVYCHFEADIEDTPRLSYDEYYNIIHHWRDIISNLTDTFGYDYVARLKDYCDKEHIKKMGDTLSELNQKSNYYIYGESTPVENILDYYALSIDDEIKLNILTNNTVEYEKNFVEFLKYITTIVEYYPPDTIMNAVEDETFYISGMLAKYGRHEEALSLLMACYTNESSMEHPRYDLIESYGTRIAAQAVRMGDREIAQKMTFLASMIFDEDQAILIVYDDINNLLEDLLTITQLYYDSDGYRFDINQAIKYANEAQKIILENRRGRNGKPVKPIIKCAVYRRLGMLCAENGDYILSEQCYRDVIAINGELFFDFDAYSGLGAVLASQGRYEDAEEVLKECLEYGKTVKISDYLLMSIYNNLTYIAQCQGDSVKVASNLSEHFDALKTFYITNTQSLTNQGRRNFWESYIWIEYASYLYGSCAMITPLVSGTAYDALLFHKNILVRQSRIIEDNILGSDDEEMKRSYQLYKDAVRTGKRKESVMYESKAMHLYSSHPEFRSSFKFQSWKDVQQMLNAEDVAIEFTEASGDVVDTVNYYLAFVVKKGYLKPKLVKLCPVHMLDSVVLHNQNLEGYSQAYTQRIDKENVLYSLIWSNLESELSGVKRVYFSPSGILCQVNIEILAKKHNSKRMCDKYKIYRLSSTGQLCSSDSGIDNNVYSSAILFGDLDYNASISTQSFSNGHDYNTVCDRFPIDKANITRGKSINWTQLCETKNEIDKIGDDLKSIGVNVVILTKEQGTEGAFKSLDGKDCSILHLATHGFYYSDAAYRKLSISDENASYITPLKRCGLIMAGGNHLWKGEDLPENVEDGTLRGDEIAGMDLSSTKLLVLSACQTALGDLESDGVYGLQRGFKLAGVHTLIMSLWEVNSAATEMMMTAFYDCLMSGRSKREAFVNAQKKVRKTYTRAYIKKNFGSNAPQDPEYYWGSFIMVD